MTETKTPSKTLLATIVIGLSLVAAVMIWRHTSPFSRCVRESVATYGVTESKAIGLCASLR